MNRLVAHKPAEEDETSNITLMDMVLNHYMRGIKPLIIRILYNISRLYLINEITMFKSTINYIFI